MSTMRLSDFLRNHADQIVSEWERFARTCVPAAESMDVEALRDHAAEMLKAIAVDLEASQSTFEQVQKALGHAPIAAGAADTGAQDHGSHRARGGFTIEQMVAEFRALRASVLRLWSTANDSLSGGDITDLARFHEAIDQALAESTARYVQVRDGIQHELMEQLREADRRKDEFLAILAHELRNPLAALTYAHRVLEVTAPVEKANPALGIARRQVQQLGRLVSDLLEIARLTRGQIELRPEPMALQVAVYNAAESAQQMIESNKHQLQIEMPHEPIYVQADPIRVAQMLDNLLSNAAKYTREGGVIRIEVAQDSDAVEVRVIDNGVGISPADIPRLFTLFTQLPSPLDKAHGGLGIGLALVKRLAELHGGAVAAESAGLGHGAKFTIRLPRRIPRKPA